MGKSDRDIYQRNKMAKRTKKVGICGKYGTRYGSSLRKISKKFEVSQHMKYTAPCGKMTLKRQAAGIWFCRRSGLKLAGGAWQPSPLVAQAAKTTMIRLRKLQAEKQD